MTINMEGPRLAESGSQSSEIGRAAKSHKQDNSSQQKENQEGIRLLDSRDPYALTILQSVYNKRLGRCPRQTKFVEIGGEIQPREGGRHFRGCGIDVGTFDRLLANVGYALGRERAFAVHGAIIEDVDTNYMLRVITDGVDPYTGKPYKATLFDRAGFAFAMDIDELPCPLGAESLEDQAYYVRSKLPPEFQGVRCIVTATSSWGIKPGLHLRVWFLTDRPLTCGEKRQWLKDISWIDPAIYSPNQPIYTAAPQFRDEAENPLPGLQRLVVLDGKERVTPPLAEALKPKVYPKPSPANYRPPAGDDRGVLSFAMSRVAAAPVSDRHNEIVRQAFWLMERVVHGEVCREKALRALTAVGTRVIPGARIITEEEVIKAWDHAERRVAADWAIENQPRRVYDENDMEVSP